MVMRAGVEQRGGGKFLLTILVYQPKREWKIVLPNHSFPMCYQL